MSDFWSPLRAVTRSRIGLGRSGDTTSVHEVLQARIAHAMARDAVWQPLDVEALRIELPDLVEVPSRATDRSSYLRRPDLGRVPHSLDAVPSGPFDIGLVIADGLSTRAVNEHAAAMVDALSQVFAGRLTMSPPVVATLARVAIGDHLAAAMQASTVLVLIGERPGLSVADSLGIYLTHRPRPGCRDSERNCISNIHGHGLSYAQAARTVAVLVDGARQLGESGVRLKDTSGELER
jgi:ethanolamine ammonia-lyase small subunit